MQLFTMPSGDVLCHVAHTVKLTFDDAQAFCQDMGLRGLVEARVPKGKHGLSFLTSFIIFFMTETLSLRLDGKILTLT